MAEVVRYVDPDATGADDGTSWTDAYTSLSAWEAAEQTDLTSDGDWHHVYCRASSGTADTTAFFINGWTTGPSNYILIEAADGDRAVKTGIDANRYRLSTGSSVPIQVYEDYVRIDGLQFSVTSATNVVGCNYNDSDTDVRITNCYAEVTGSSNQCVAFNTGDRSLTLENTVVHGTDRGIYSNGGNVDVFNCVFRGDGTNYGIRRDSSGTVTVTNCAIFNFSDDFVGTITIDHCASDDGDGTNSVSPSGSDWDNEFSDPADGDFTLLNTGNLYDAGVGPSTDSDVPSTDIDGDSRSGSSCDIGVDEYVSGGTTAVPVFLHHYKMAGGL